MASRSVNGLKIITVLATKHEHIQDTIEGWFNFQNLYRQIAEWIPDGGKALRF